jgi:hypothetical protein
MRGLSKNRVLDGHQCPLLLWRRVHESDAPELIPGPREQALFDVGVEVGIRARDLFPEGVLARRPIDTLRDGIRKTHALVEAGSAPIFEASFSADGVFCAVDILEPSPEGWIVNEVKASTSVKPHHVLDLAVQVHVLRACGLRVVGSRLVHLDRECRYPDLSNLFIKADLTNEVEGELVRLPRLVGNLREVLDGDEPHVEVGPHCGKPYACSFMSRCYGSLPQFSVEEFYRLHATKRHKLASAKIKIISEVPAKFSLTAIQERQHRAIVSGTMVIEPGLAGALEFPGEGSRAFMDFETIYFPIPRWDGCRPWQQIPVQFSVHRDVGHGLEHVEHLAEAGEDPRPKLARALVDAVPKSGPVFVYYEPFEGMRLRELAEAVPELGAELLDLERRLVDLLPIVRDHIYDPGFRGSFSIKSVLPVLCPGAGWDDLAVKSGDVAAVHLQELLLAPKQLDRFETALRRRALLAYCEQDTRALVVLLERLRELVSQR